MTTIEAASLAGRLRTHARRCKNEPGYRTPGGIPRAAFAAQLRRWTRMLARAKTAERLHEVLAELEEVNP